MTTTPISRDSAPPRQLASTRAAPPGPPPRVRNSIVPSASESALINPLQIPLPPLPPAQPTRCKPFLLRGISGGSTARNDKGKQVGLPPVPEKAKDDAKFKRSKTMSVLDSPATTATSMSAASSARVASSSRPAAPPAAKQRKKRDPSFRPLSLAPASLHAYSSSSLPSRQRSAPHAPPLRSPADSVSSPSSSTRLEAVEQHKLALKQERLKQRRTTIGGLPILPDESNGDSTAGMSRSKRWFSRLTYVSDKTGAMDGSRENVPPARSTGMEAPTPASSSLLSDEQGQDRHRSHSPAGQLYSPSTESFSSSASPRSPLSPTTPFGLVKERSTRRFTLPSKPSLRNLHRQAEGVEEGGKKKLGGLGMARLMRSRENLHKDLEPEEPREVPVEMRHEEGYSSLQELLERAGPRERIVPSKSSRSLRSSASSRNLRSSNSASSLPRRNAATLAVPSAAPKERPSLLSLRGIFSFLSSTDDDAPPPSPSVPDTASYTASSGPPSPAFSPSPTFPTSPTLVSSPGLTIPGSSSATPQLDPSGHFGSPCSSSGVSYSSSLSISPPTPASGLRPTFAVAGPCSSSPGNLSTPRLAPAKHSLRHAVSDSGLGLGGSMAGSDVDLRSGGYASFTGLGITVPSSFLTVPYGRSPPVPASSASSPTSISFAEPPTPTLAPTTTTPAGPKLSPWLAPSLFLRERASQIFSSSPSSAVDTAVGHTAAQRQETNLNSNNDSGGGGSGRGVGPRLLRKAVSTAGLVCRPVTTQATVVGEGARSMSSVESLAGSIDR
ncbi:hypothetical protein JCM11641_007886 [Rhodosporidiobolus odoratus]